MRRRRPYKNTGEMLQGSSSSNPFHLLDRQLKLVDSIGAYDSDLQQYGRAFDNLHKSIWTVIYYQWPLLLSASGGDSGAPTSPRIAGDANKGLGLKLLASWWKRYLLAFWLKTAASLSPTGKKDAWQLAWDYLKKNGDLEMEFTDYSAGSFIPNGFCKLSCSNGSASSSGSAVKGIEGPNGSFRPLTPAFLSQIKSRISRDYSINSIFFKLVSRDLSNSGFISKFNVNSSKADYMNAIDHLLLLCTELLNERTPLPTSVKKSISASKKGSLSSSVKSLKKALPKIGKQQHSPEPNEQVVSASAEIIQSLKDDFEEWRFIPITSYLEDSIDATKSRHLARLKFMLLNMQRQILCLENENRKLSKRIESIHASLDSFVGDKQIQSDQLESTLKKLIQSLEKIASDQIECSSGHLEIPPWLQKPWLVKKKAVDRFDNTNGSFTLPDLWQKGPSREVLDPRQLEALELELSKVFRLMHQKQLGKTDEKDDIQLTEAMQNSMELISSLTVLFPSPVKIENGVKRNAIHSLFEDWRKGKITDVQLETLVQHRIAKVEDKALKWKEMLE